MLSEIDNYEMLGQTGYVQLKEPIHINNILKGQAFEINDNQIDNDDDEENIPKDDEIAAFTDIDLDVDSDDRDDITSIPFEKLAEKMENVTDDGKIKKRIKRSGVGSTPLENALVEILYCSYLEFNDEPIDYAFIKKPHQFRLGTSGIIGLNFAVETMKVNEKSYFLIHPDYAFGTLGHPPRVPPNATFFFQVELLRFKNSDIPLHIEELTLEKKNQFQCVYNKAINLNLQAKEHLKQNSKLAIRNYQDAVGLIDRCQLINIEEQEEILKLKLKILTNLAICYNKENLPKKACSMCNNIFAMAKIVQLTIPAKVFFQNAKALVMLGDYAYAKKKLLIAQRIEPHDQEIKQELIKINAKLEEAKHKEKEFAMLSMQANKNVSETSEKATNENLNDDFLKLIAALCDNLVNSEDQQCALPAGLTDKEYDIVKNEAEKLGLLFKVSNDNEDTFYISKV